MEHSENISEEFSQFGLRPELDQAGLDLNPEIDGLAASTKCPSRSHRPVDPPEFPSATGRRSSR